MSEEKLELGPSPGPSSLGLEGLHVFITGAADGDGQCVVEEFLDHGCKVTALDSSSSVTYRPQDYERFNYLQCDIYNEKSIQSSFSQAIKRFGPVNILVADPGEITEPNEYSIWDLPLKTWEKTSRADYKAAFLLIKHFLKSAQTAQQSQGKDLDNLSIVVTGSKTVKFDQAGLYGGLVYRVKNDMRRLNNRARINTVVSGSVDTSMSDGMLSFRIAKPDDVARGIAFLASHRAAYGISGQCMSVDGCAEGRYIWKENKLVKLTPVQSSETETVRSIPSALSMPKRNKIRIAVSIDLDAVSGWLGTGHHPDNVLADYSAGFFAARVGVPRLLKMLKKLDLANRCTWFIPGHSAESFPEQVQQVVESGCEIGLHGYAHEGAYQLTPEQERDVLVRCIDISTKLTGKKPAGYRAPLYQLRESTLDLLEEYGFEYDASLTDYDCHPFFAPRRPPLTPIDFSKPASSWMHPIPQTTTDRRPLVCVPCNWYMEDMTPMQYLPHVHNSHGYTDVRVIENLWRDRFLWIRENEEEPIFPVLMHPDTSGMAHIIGMLERLLGWLKGWGHEVEFCQTGEIARWYREKEMRK